MKTLVLITALLLSSSPVFAEDSFSLCKDTGLYCDKWRTQDVILEVAWEGFHLVDWVTTRQITMRPDRYYEMNPALGRHPSKDKVDFYMFSGAVLHPVVTRLLPVKVNLWDYDIPVRNIFQGVTIGMSGTCAVNNLTLGLKFAW